MATRRLTTPDGRLATIDHGAQFFTVRSETFASLAEPWIASGLVSEWCRGFSNEDGHPRYAVRGGMTTLAKHLATGLDVRTSTLVFSVRASSGAWTITIDDGSSLEADAVVMTCPIPQSYSLTVESGVEFPRELLMADYDRTIGLLAILDGPSALPPPGGVQNPDGIFSWIADNAAKGVSDVHALTCHANPEWSASHWEDDVATGTAQLMEHARTYFGAATCVVSDYKKWRFATPRQPWSEPFLAHGSLVFAGDAFAGPKMEGAAVSGLAAARHVRTILD